MFSYFFKPYVIVAELALSSLSCVKYEYLLRNTEAVVQRCSVKRVFLEISQNSQENTCARVSFLIKLQAEVFNFIKKETLAQVFSCEFCEISKNTFFHRTPLAAASGNVKYKCLKLSSLLNDKKNELRYALLVCLQNVY